MQYLIYSASTAFHSEDDAGFWSNDHGWVTRDDATQFTADEKECFGLPISEGCDACWMQWHDTSGQIDWEVFASETGVLWDESGNKIKIILCDPSSDDPIARVYCVRVGGHRWKLTLCDKYATRGIGRPFTAEDLASIADVFAGLQLTPDATNDTSVESNDARKGIGLRAAMVRTYLCYHGYLMSDEQRYSLKIALESLSPGRFRLLEEQAGRHVCDDTADLIQSVIENIWRFLHAASNPITK